MTHDPWFVEGSPKQNKIKHNSRVSEFILLMTNLCIIATLLLVFI